MIKDIVVNLSVAPIHDVAGDFAVSLAATFNAHLAGIAFMYEPVYGPVSDLGTLSADVLGRVRSENRSAVEAIIAKFDRIANQAGLSAEARALDDFRDHLHGNNVFNDARRNGARQSRRTCD